jgi:hypothetical protein
VPKADLAIIEQRIYTIRGVRVILDADLAALYGVPTFRFNEAIKRNKNRFPPDFMFQLSQAEFEALISQIAMSKRRGGRRTRPYAFTEHGALQAANVLRSSRAAQMSLFESPAVASHPLRVIRAFVKMREQLMANAAILKRLTEIDKTLLVHDSALRDLYQKLLPLLSPVPDPPKRQIGFGKP